MEQFKVEHFINQNPNLPFPLYSPLKSDELRLLNVALGEKLKLVECQGGAEYLKAIYQSAVVYKDVNAQDDSFSLRELAARCGIEPDQEVLVNWYRFDSVDRIAFDDLSRHFTDIWYPGVDDIDIFDWSLSWFIAVSHEGAVYVSRL